ncbi:MAG: LPS export ABC transporter periplasmic protein LptC [Saccharospirillaceae bacterium]|nr:LPS export ABC transporter periplasmic protein LptC [Pseudomonadales bacterium]NRB79646.1 LPS export ABC transporter periplasmic protein LptC [Saccharospirillaceae bacterium]
MLLINSNPIQSNIKKTSELIVTNDIQQLGEDVYQIQYNELGQKKMEVESELYTKFKSGKQQFKQPIFNIFQKQPNDQLSTLNWVIQADNGYIQQTDILTLKGNVEGNRISSSSFKFQTDWLNYNFENKTIDSEADIAIWQEHNTMNASGFNMNLKSNKIDIQLHNNVLFNFLEVNK